MAVANTKSQAISALDTEPIVIPGGYLHGGPIRKSTGLVEVAAADSDGSVYRMCRLPSNAVIEAIEILNDAIAGATDYDIGVYQSLRNGGAVVDDDLFADTLDMTVARALPLDAMFEKLDIDQSEKRLWELLGLSADPNREYDICVTGQTVGSAAGTVVLRVKWSI